MVQHDSRVRRYNRQSTGMGGTGGRRITEAQYGNPNAYLSDYEQQQEYSANDSQAYEYDQHITYHQDTTYAESNKISLDYMELFAQGNSSNQRNSSRQQMSSGSRYSSAKQANAQYDASSERRTNAGYGNPSRRRTNSDYSNSYRQPANTGYNNAYPKQTRTNYGNSYGQPAGAAYDNASPRQTNSGYHTPSRRGTASGYRTDASRHKTNSMQQNNARYGNSEYGKSIHGRAIQDYDEKLRRRKASSHRQTRTVSLRNQPQRRHRRRMLMQRLAVSIWALCVIFLIAILLLNRNSPADQGQRTLQNSGQSKTPSTASGAAQPDAALIQGIPASDFAAHPEWTEDFLTPNEYSRPGDPLESVTNIFVHYTANPGTTAAQNRSYFERQKDEHTISVSSHFIIDTDGEIIQCVPLDEIAYAVVGRNFDSISIECCHLTKDGSFTQETYDSLISLLAWLTEIYDLDSDDILRHYDCGGKKCPLYYTEHPDEWEELKKDVDNL